MSDYRVVRRRTKYEQYLYSHAYSPYISSEYVRCNNLVYVAQRKTLFGWKSIGPYSNWRKCWTVDKEEAERWCYAHAEGRLKDLDSEVVSEFILRKK